MNYTINVSIPKPLAEMAHEQVRKGHYTSVSEVIRDALRKLLVNEKIPTFKMSRKAEKIAEKAYKEYKSGKAHILKSLDDFDTL